jgi:hypothetical protein
MKRLNTGRRCRSVMPSTHPSIMRTVWRTIDRYGCPVKVAPDFPG